MLVNNLIGLWLVPYSLKYLTREEFSLYYIATDLMMWLSVVNLGTSSVFITRVAQVMGKAGDTTKEVLSLVNTAFFVQCFFALIAIVLGAAASLVLPLFFETGQYATEFQTTFLILSFSVGFTLIGQVFSGLLVASKQIHIDNLIQILLIIPRIVLTILLLHLGYGILALALVNLFVSFLGILIPYIRVRRRLAHLKIAIHFFQKKMVRDFLGNGVWFSIGGVAGILILNMDRFVIGNFIGLTLVSNFIITQKLYDIANKVISLTVNVSRPYLAQSFGLKDMNSMKSGYTALFILSLVISSILGSLIFIVNKYFISTWVGDGFYAGDEINLFMALNFILQSSVLPNRVISATTLFKIRLHAFIRLADGLTNLLLSILLAKTLGILGVVIASVVTTALFSNVALTILTQQFFKLNEMNFDKKLNGLYIIIGFPVLFFFVNQVTFLGSLALFVALVFSFAFYFFLKRNQLDSFLFIKNNIFRKIN